MELRTRVFVTIVFLVGLIGGLYLFSDWFSKATGYALGEDQKTAFANCLNERGSALYESESCSACEKQNEILGENAYAIIRKVICGSDLCGGLVSVPAWELDGKIYYGIKTYKQLDELSGCAIAER